MKREKFRPMKDLSHEERKEILLDCQVMPAEDIREKWEITQNTLNHIKFFHGKSNAKANGYYYKDLIGDELSPKALKIKAVKDAGGNSEQAAEKEKVPLELVNKLWPRL